MILRLLSFALLCSWVLQFEMALLLVRVDIRGLAGGRSDLKSGARLFAGWDVGILPESFWVFTALVSIKPKDLEGSECKGQEELNFFAFQCITNGNL